MKDTLWIGTSWKMHKTLPEAMAFAAAVKDAGVARSGKTQLFLVPPFTAVREVRTLLRDEPILIGAQNMHWDDQGAWTGEISPLMLKDCGLDLVELGHSERRAHFGETDATVGLKVEAAVRHGLIPLICIGETLGEKQAGRAGDVLEAQVRAALSKLSPSQKAARVVFAYEPVWAIGAHGIPAAPEYADARQAEIAAVARDVMGQRVPCLYGGSVNPENCAELVACPHIDGVFIGRSAWEVQGFLDIVARCAEGIDG